MALTNTDRRRFFLATAVTLLALPALWWANQAENSRAPNVAVAGAEVGVDVGADHQANADTNTDSSTDSAQSTPIDTAPPLAPTATPTTMPTPAPSDDDRVGAIAPVFLDGPSGDPGAGLAEIAVPARPAVARITTTATFRSNLGSDVCLVPGLMNGRTVTVVNLDNGHSASCVTVLAQGQLADQITLDTRLFASLADVTDAPIPVEIRQ